MNMPTPKNYISSGISKKLLTPCRRVGLSRSKKTPNTIKGSPLTTYPHTAVDTPNKNIETRSDLDTKCIELLKETPKKPSPRRAKKVNSKIDTKTIGKKTVEVDESPKIMDNCKIARKPNITSTNKKISSPNDSLKDSPIQDVPSKVLVSVEVHHPVAKRSINFNIIDEHSSITNEKDDDIVISSKPTPGGTSIQEKKPEINRKRKFRLESDDFTIKSNEKLPEHNSPKRSIHFNMIDEHSSLDSSITNVKDENIVVSSKRTSEGTSIQEENPEINRKCTFRLESDDFTIKTNEKSPEHNSAKTSKSSKHSIPKYTSATSNESSNAITLGRFTTEDYLKEFSCNPENFHKNLGEGNFAVAAIRNNEDIEAFSSSLDRVRSKKLKSKDAGAVKDCLNKKQYVAILCPSVEQSTNVNLKHSVSTKKSSLKLKKVSAASKPNVKQKLTVSLERLPKVDIKCKTKTDDKVIQDLPSSPGFISSKTTHFKINNFDENDDDELFTSSPENDKKQRANLLQLIQSIEIEISQKQMKLEKLNQAQVYKLKHSPEKLKVSSDRWLEGCRAGLNDLLLKMQEHGPIEMDTLTKKLRISDDILEKLQL